MDPSMKITTHDMHTGGEPLRIITSGYPELLGSSVLEKRDYAQNHLDHYRKFLMNEPRGHKDMYGAAIWRKKDASELESKGDGGAIYPKKDASEFEVIFLNNEGYSTMCGHAVIALGRYVVDYALVEAVEPETEVIFHCPCGPVTAFVEFAGGKSGSVRFKSVPAFVYKLGAKITVPELGAVTVDISFGGAFYVIVSERELAIDLDRTPLDKIVRIATAISDVVKETIPIQHPENEELSFLYGVIVTDGKDAYSEGPSTNVCVFADKQVDRSPTGSGVTARIALQVQKGTMSLNQGKEFRSILGTSFKGKAVHKTVQGDFPAVIVEVSGIAHHTGDHTFYLEDTDPFKEGFQL